MDDAGMGRPGIARRSFLSHGAVIAGGAVGAGALGGARPAAASTIPTAAPTVVVSTFTSAAIQSAINALPATGGVVQLVLGIYAVTASIALRSGCELLGAGRNATTLRLASGTNLPVVRNADATGDAAVSVRSLLIDGNRSGQSHSGNAHGIELHRCANFVLDDLEVMQCDGNGILVSGNGTVTRIGSIRNVFAHDNAVHGIWVTWAMREITYTGVTCDLNGQDGLVVDHSESVANGVHCSRNGRDGIRITNVVANNLVGILADLNGRNGIHALGFVNSLGAAWTAHNNGRHEPASDVYFDGTLNTYGPTDHAIVHGIECGAVQRSTWGAPYPPNPTPTETYGLTVDPTIQGNLTLLGVRNCGGSAGDYSLAPVGSTGSLVLLDHALGTGELRLLRGNLHVAGGDLAHDSSGKLGFYGAPVAAQPVVSGDMTGDPTAVLQSLLGALSTLGLVADQTTQSP